MIGSIPTVSFLIEIGSIPTMGSCLFYGLVVSTSVLAYRMTLVRFQIEQPFMLIFCPYDVMDSILPYEGNYLGSIPSGDWWSYRSHKR